MDPNRRLVAGDQRPVLATPRIADVGRNLIGQPLEIGNGHVRSPSSGGFRVRR
jgi:hypothetical protein